MTIALTLRIAGVDDDTIAARFAFEHPRGSTVRVGGAPRGRTSPARADVNTTCSASWRSTAVRLLSAEPPPSDRIVAPASSPTRLSGRSGIK
jgi:hypothetical protein